MAINKNTKLKAEIFKLTLYKNHVRASIKEGVMPNTYDEWLKAANEKMSIFYDWLMSEEFEDEMEN